MTVARSATVSAGTRQLAIGGGAVLTAGLVAVGGLQMTSAFSGTETTTQRMHYAAVRSLEIDNDSGRVEVVGDSATGVSVQRRMRTAITDPDVSAGVTGGTLRLSGTCSQNVFWSECEVSYVVHVPHATTVTVRNDSGAVRASELSAPVDLHSGSGSVTATDITGQTNLSVDSGRIEADKVTGPVVALHTDSGSITGTSLSAGSVTATTDSGSVDLDLATAPRRVSAHVSSGRVDVGLPDTPGGYAVTDRSNSGERIVGAEVQVNSASARVVDVSTDSGSIDVHRR